MQAPGEYAGLVDGRGWMEIKRRIAVAKKKKKTQFYAKNTIAYE